MKIFIDSANLDELEAGARSGLVDGCTTNPSLVAKSGMNFEELIHKITEIIDGPISAEVTATTCDEMVEEGKKLAAIHPNIVVKVPLIAEGLAATKKFTDLGIKTNVTLCFSTVQAVLAAKAGATYVSPFVGRLDDIGEDGMQLIRDIKTAFDHYGYKTQILVASIRSVAHVLETIKIGAHVATIPYKIFTQLPNHPLTTSGLERFLKDWENSKK